MASHSTTGYEPDWARVPPHVPTYPNPLAYFRQVPAEKYTAPTGKKAYEKPWTKWHAEFPEWREEHYRLDSRAPVMRWTEHQSGVMRPAYTAPRAHPEWRQEYMRQARPDTETMRARGINKLHWNYSDKNNYQFTNAMTSTQYKKPVTGIYGPLLRQEVHGVYAQKNRHGFMPAADYYF